MACKFDYAALLLASALALAPVHALATPKVLSVTETVRAEEFGQNSLVQDTGPQTADPSGTKARVTLGDGLDAFNQPAFAEAFAALPNGVPSFWVSLSSDSSLPPLLGGNGRASAEVTFTAIKKPRATLLSCT